MVANSVRTTRIAVCPTASHMRRTRRFRPSVTTICNQVYLVPCSSISTTEG